MSTTTEDAPAQTPPAPRPRDRYIDVLRAVAIIFVVTIHTMTPTWLMYSLPAMGLMFAFGGALLAGSLDRANHQPVKVIAKRVQRLLPPVWFMGAIMVPLMIYFGWTHTNEGPGASLTWKVAFSWLFPLIDPQSPDWAYENMFVQLWFIRAYLWFLLLSPALLFLFRRWPKRVIATPLVVMGLIGLGYLNWSTSGGAAVRIAIYMAMFGNTWLLGFSLYEGKLRRWRLLWVVPAGLVLMLLGVWYLLWNPQEGSEPGLRGLPDNDFAYASYTLGMTLLFLRFRPSFQWLERVPVLDKFVMALNLRMMTIYIWGNVATFVSEIILNRSSWIPQTFKDEGHYVWASYAITWLLVIFAVVAFGWIEDVAGRRRPQFNPWPKSRPRIEPIGASAPKPTTPRPHTAPLPAVRLWGSAAAAAVARPRLAAAGGTLALSGVAAVAVTSLLMGAGGTGTNSSASGPSDVAIVPSPQPAPQQPPGTQEATASGVKSQAEAETQTGGRTAVAFQQPVLGTRTSPTPWLLRDGATATPVPFQDSLLGTVTLPTPKPTPPFVTPTPTQPTQPTQPAQPSKPGTPSSSPTSPSPTTSPSPKPTANPTNPTTPPPTTNPTTPPPSSNPTTPPPTEPTTPPTTNPTTPPANPTPPPTEPTTPPPTEPTTPAPEPTTAAPEPTTSSAPEPTPTGGSGSAAPLQPVLQAIPEAASALLP